MNSMAQIFFLYKYGELRDFFLEIWQLGAIFLTQSSMTCFFGHHLEKIHQEKKHWIASQEGFSIKCCHEFWKPI